MLLPPEERLPVLPDPVVSQAGTRPEAQMEDAMGVKQTGGPPEVENQAVLVRSAPGEL